MIIREYLYQKRKGAFDTPPGFNAHYHSFTHYILDITEQIWEKRAIWLLYDTYAEDVVIYSGATTTTTLDAVITGTLKTLYSFPDRNMLGEAVIWSRYEDTINKTATALANSMETRFFSSHRIMSHATNIGSTVYGKPTGKKIHFRTIADCLAKDNHIYMEWLARDNLHIIQQLGFNPITLAKLDTRYDGIDVQKHDDGCKNILTQHHTKIHDSAIECICSLFEIIWNKKQYNTLDTFYHDTAISHGICDAMYTCNDNRSDLFDNLFTPFSNTALMLQQITATYYEDKTEIAVRWRLYGTHSNTSKILGDATLSTANILGINHYVLTDNKISEEWMIYDAYDTLCQLYRK